MHFPFYFNIFFLVSFPGDAVLQLHKNVFFLFYCIAGIIIVSFYALLDGVCLSGNKRITYLLTNLLTLTYAYHRRYFYPYDRP